MPGCRSASRKAHSWYLVLLWISVVNAQTCLVLSSPVPVANGAMEMDLSLYSSSANPPAAIQWTLRFPASSLTSITVDDGPMLISVGKTAICAGDATAYNCLAVGTNANTIATGVIAKITAVLGPVSRALGVQISNSLGVSTTGDAIPIFSRIKPVAAIVSNNCRLLPPIRGTAGGG